MGTNIIKTLGLAGAAFAAWYFLDPKKGPERRDRATKSARDVYDNLGKELTRLGDEVATVASDVVSRVGSMAGTVAGEAEDVVEGTRRAVHVE
jgi:hypothetical protein